MQSEDVQEGIQSFLERREAVFQGKKYNYETFHQWMTYTY